MITESAPGEHALCHSTKKLLLTPGVLWNGIVFGQPALRAFERCLMRLIRRHPGAR
jgi:hypothetical protein